MDAYISAAVATFVYDYVDIVLRAIFDGFDGVKGFLLVAKSLDEAQVFWNVLLNLGGTG